MEVATELATGRTSHKTYRPHARMRPYTITAVRKALPLSENKVSDTCDARTGKSSAPPESGLPSASPQLTSLRPTKLLATPTNSKMAR